MTGTGERDWRAADRLRELREDRGLSREALAHEIAILAAKGNTPYPVSAKTIYRIETSGAVPTVRVKFALAQFFDLVPSELWTPRRHRVSA